MSLWWSEAIPGFNKSCDVIKCKTVVTNNKRKMLKRIVLQEFCKIYCCIGLKKPDDYYHPVLFAQYVFY